MDVVLTALLEMRWCEYKVLIKAVAIISWSICGIVVGIWIFSEFLYQVNFLGYISGRPSDVCHIGVVLDPYCCMFVQKTTLTVEEASEIVDQLMEEYDFRTWVRSDDGYDRLREKFIADFLVDPYRGYSAIEYLHESIFKGFRNEIDNICYDLRVPRLSRPEVEELLKNFENWKDTKDTIMRNYLEKKWSGGRR